MGTEMNVVDALRGWLRENEAKLKDHGIDIEDRIPTRESNSQTKASIGLGSANIALSFTVWDRLPIQAELIVVSKKLQQTLLFKDYQKATVDEVLIELDDAASSLISCKYDNMQPDPRFLAR